MVITVLASPMLYSRRQLETAKLVAAWLGRGELVYLMPPEGKR
jgi:hypothetical protein